MATSNVLIVFDTEGILGAYGNTPGTFANPTFINANYIYMVTEGKQAISGQAGGELNLAAAIGDNIRWREATLSLGMDQAALMYNFIATGGGSLISTPQALVATVTVPFPNPANPQQPSFVTEKNFFWQCTALAQGKVTYHFQFMITDRYGQIKGYYQWDPFITITN